MRAVERRAFKTVVDAQRRQTPSRALSPAERYMRAPWPATDPDPKPDAHPHFRRFCRAGKRFGFTATPVAPLGTEKWRRGLTRHLCQHLPADLHDLRRFSCILDFTDWTTQYGDVPCPACVHSPGWLDSEYLEACPLCCGFRFVPRPVATWFRTTRDAIEADAASEVAWDTRAEILESP